MDKRSRLHPPFVLHLSICRILHQLRVLRASWYTGKLVAKVSIQSWGA